MPALPFGWRAGVRLRVVSDLAHPPVVVGAEAVEDAVEASVHEPPSVGDLGAVYPGHRQLLGHVHAGVARAGYRASAVASARYLGRLAYRGGPAHAFSPRG